MSQVLGALSPMSMALPSDATLSGAAGLVGTMSTPQSHSYAQIFSQTNSSLQNTIVSSSSSSLETAQTNMNLHTPGNQELGGQSSAMLPPPMIPPGQLPVSITPLSQIPNSFPQTSQPPSVYAAPAHIFTSNQAPAVQSQTQNSSLGGRPLSLPGQSQATPMAAGASTAGGGFGQGSTTQYGTYHPPAVYMAPPMPPSTQMVPPGVLGSAPPGAMRYQAPSFSPIIRQPAFPPRPPLGPPPMMSTGRPPIMGGMRPLPLLKPPLGMGHILPLEKPHTTIYVGKIATTIEDEFIRSVLELCGPIKSWKRAQDPTTNSPKRFGFCEYETPEGVLRALRLLNKYSMDGQELVLNVDTTTRDYLERYVSRKKENEKLLKEAAQLEKEEETAPGVEVPLAKPAEEKDSEDASGSEEAAKKFGIVNEDDKQGDDTAFEKLKSMLEERAKSKPLPPPPGPPSADLGAKSSEISVKSKDGDSNIDGTRSDDPNARIEDETTSERKSAVDGERMEASSSDRGKRTERDRERDRERDIEREREREIERVEREREKERIRRERERDHRVREAERAYEERSKEWEARERDKERQRLHDKDRDKERERERRRQIKEQEEDTDDEDDDDWRKRRHRQEEKRKRRMREREDDLTDRLKEQQEILEPKRQKLQEVPRKMDVDGDSASKNGAETPQKISGSVSDANKIPSTGLSSNGIHEVANDGGTLNKATGDETELKLGQSFIPRKLGFGLIGAGKRTAVLPVFHEEDEEEAPKEKRMRPLVPIDYSAEEMEAVNAKSLSAGPSPNLAAAAEFAKSLSGLTPRSPSKDDRRDDFDRRKQKDRSSEKGRYRERERDRERDRDKEKEREREKDRDRERDKGKDRERTKEKDRDREKERTGDKNKPPDNTKILDAKQLIDTIPKTKEELFGYPVDWSIYDKHDLHERMRPWIAKKITEFLGEEETTLVDYILTNTRKHVTAAGMLEVLEGILDDEAEMFVLKMWRMLIFEIKRIETGLALKQPKA